MSTYIDLSFNQEWKVIANFESNLQMCFDRIQKQFFGKWLKDVKFIVKWDKTGIISDGSSFKIFESHKEILVKSTGMTRPRVQLFSVLMHVLIHIYLKKGTSDGTITINMHDENFRKIMLHLNDTLNMKISVKRKYFIRFCDFSYCLSFQTFHKFLDSPDQADYPTQWYQCTGICSAYEPFHGTIRCTSIPDESHSFFKAHDSECGGQFFRVFEMSRKNPETNETENAYVRNTHYMFPKSRATGKSHKACQQVREILDLTEDDAEGSVVIQNLCDVINLDDSDYANDDENDNELVNNFIKQPFLVFSKCPFCVKIIGTTLLAEHFDKCRGFQEKVVYKLSRK